jgi:hypothetical protein
MVSPSLPKRTDRVAIADAVGVTLRIAPSLRMRLEQRNHAVKIRRIFAVSLVGLLLFVSSMAAACDLSCGFALFRSDCHSPEMAATDSGASDMTMAGMRMAERADEDSTDQQIASSPQQAMPAHAVLADMGACERQSCDQAQALASKANHSTTTQLDGMSTIAGSSRIDNLQGVFHDARGGIARISPVVHSPLAVTLRI